MAITASMAITDKVGVVQPPQPMDTFFLCTVSARLVLCAFVAGVCFTVLLAQGGAYAQGSNPSPTASSPAKTQPAESEAEAGDRLVSLVLLLSAPRKPSHELIAHAISEGLGTKISKDAVVTKPPYHLVSVGDDKFVVNDIPQPYFEKTAEVAGEIKNPTLSEAVRAHRAWISVDWVSAEQTKDLRNAYKMIGKMVAHLSGKDTLAVYSPDMDQFALWVPAVREGLESDDPLAVFEPPQTNQTAETPAASPSPSVSP